MSDDTDNHENPYDSFSGIIRLWPSLQDFATDLRIPYVNANLMRQRDSISAEHWADMVDAAAKRGIPGVTADHLARLKAAKERHKRPLARRRTADSAAVA